MLDGHVHVADGPGRHGEPHNCTGIRIAYLADANTDYSGCGSFPTITGCDLFVGFEFTTNMIGSIQFAPSATSGDAFAIDNFRLEGTAVPEPAGIALQGLGLLGLGFASRRNNA